VADVPCSRASAVSIGGKPVNDILIGGKGQAGDFGIVDYVTRLNKGAATIFSKDGERFVRIATNVMKDDGTRAVGTELNNTTQAYAQLKIQRPFYGVVDILGNPYFTAYEPLLAKNGEAIGIAYVGYKAELPVLSQALEQSHLLKSGFVAVVDSSKARYMPSWVTAEQVQQATDNKDDSWVINRLPLSEWGLTIVSAYPAAELRAEGRKIGYGVALAGVVLGAAISLTLYLLTGSKGIASARRRASRRSGLHEENRRRRFGGRRRGCRRTARQSDGLAESDATEAEKSDFGSPRRRSRSQRAIAQVRNGFRHFPE
jgi:methyl-accepting chemotaxis protein